MNTPTPPAAQVRDLTKTYGTHHVVNRLNFTIPVGAVVGLIGPNGAGKTTTMKMMLGLVEPSVGQVELLGCEHRGHGWSSSLQRVGSMIEEPPIYSRMTARENLRYQSLAVSGSVDDDQIDGLLRLVDLHDRADDRPRAYSLGMKQRLGIAITMIGAPELVILDEPANGLDPAGILEIRNLLRRLPEAGTTVLVSSHQLAEVQQACDQLVILANGELVTEGSTQAILDANTSSALTIELRPDEVVPAIDVLAGAGCAAQSINAISLSVEPGNGMTGRDLSRLLSSAGIHPESLSRPQISLEQAFLEMTNQPASPVPAPAH